MKKVASLTIHPALTTLRTVPKGRVVAYKELARVCGTGARAIGAVMRRNADPAGYPCYKVVASDGALAGYSGPGGLRRKRALLEADGVRFDKNGRVLPECFYTFQTNRKIP